MEKNKILIEIKNNYIYIFYNKFYLISFNISNYLKNNIKYTEIKKSMQKLIPLYLTEEAETYKTNNKYYLYFLNHRTVKNNLIIKASKEIQKAKNGGFKNSYDRRNKKTINYNLFNI